MKILIVKMSSLGDVIHALPLAGVLKKGIPDCTIDWVVNEEYRGILTGNPDLRHVIPFKRKEWLGFPGFLKNIREIKKFAMSMKREHYDLVIDVQGLFKSALVVVMASGRKSLGFSNAREGAASFYDIKVHGNMKLHAVDRYLQLAHKLDVTYSRGDLHFPIPLHDKDRDKVDHLLSEHGLTGGTFAVFCPFSRWETKMWPEENFHSLAGLLAKKGVPVVWTGSRGESPGRKVSNDLIGKLSVNQLFYLMQKSRFVVTCDSGAMHVASAAGADIFALFGPTSHERTGPYNLSGKTVIIRRDNAQCAPCFSRTCDKQKECLVTIQPEEVMAEIEEAVRL